MIRRYILNVFLYFCNQNRNSIMNDKNFNRIKVILAEKNLPNKYLAEKLGRDQATIS